MSLLGNAADDKHDIGFTTPAEVEEKFARTPFTKVLQYLWQGGILGTGLALTTGAFLWMLWAWGLYIFAVATFIIGVANLIWTLRNTQYYEADDIAEGKVQRDVIGGILVAIFTGFVAACLWLVIDAMAPDWIFAPWAVKLQRFVSLLLLLALGTATLFLLPAYGFQAILPSVFQDQAIWSALGRIIENRLMKPPPGAELEERVIKVTVDIWYRDKNGNARRLDSVTPLQPGKDADIQLRKVAELIVNDGRTISQDNLAGSGKPLSGRTEYNKFVERLIERKLVIPRNPNAPTQGVELTIVGRKVFEALARGETWSPTLSDN